MNEDVYTQDAALPRGTQVMPGDVVRQIVQKPIVGRVSKDVPMQVDQASAKVQVLVEWDETDADGVTHVASTWFDATGDLDILSRPTAE